MLKTECNLMSPMHISKLGHEIEEIRNRALKSIYSKYNLQLVDETNVENNKNLLENLLNWFNYEKHDDADKAFKILLRLAKSDNFGMVVNELDGDYLLKQLNNVENKTDSCHLPVISEIKDLVLAVKRKETQPVITELVLQIAEEVEEDTGKELIYLPWQSLSQADRQILESTYTGLRYLDDKMSIMLGCQFLSDVVLQDFPSEVFLQRPLVLKTLLALLSTPLIASKVPVLKTISEISSQLLVRVKRLSDPGMKGERWENNTQDCDLDTKESESLKKYQLSVDEFCKNVLEKLAPILMGFETNEEKNLAVGLVVFCVMIQARANISYPIPKVFEEILAKEKFKPIYHTLLTLVLLWLQNVSDLTCGLRLEISRNIGDPGLLYFYPELHDLLLSLVAEFKDQESEQLIKDYEECLKICGSMDAAKKLNDLNLGPEEYFECMLQALPSFEFHRNVNVVEDFVRRCGSRVNDDLKQLRARILVTFLGREDIQEAVYCAIHCWVLKYGDDIDRLEFLCDSDVWNELWMFGANSKKKGVRNFCREILNEILKTHNRKFLNSLNGMFSLMSAYADTNSQLGRTILRIFDPTLAILPTTELIQGNMRLMFSKEIDVNEEAFARLCWILSKDDLSNQKLPKVSDIRGLHLSSMCVLMKPTNTPKIPQFSTARALHENLERLKSPGLVPNDRRCVLDQLSCILEDTGLHHEFLEQRGLEIILELLEKSLIERDLTVYPTSVFPLMSIFQNLARNHATVRTSLATKDSFLLNALRSLLLFTADEVFRQNAVGLIFLLVYCDQIKEDSTKISIPELIAKNLHIPITVETHYKISQHFCSNRLHLLGNKFLSRMLRVHWATLWMGDVTVVTALHENDLQKEIFSPNLPLDMMPTAADLANLQSTDPRMTLRLCLEAIHNANSHSKVYVNIERLISSLTWLETWKALPSCHGSRLDVDGLPWVAIFDRFFTTLPKSMEDEALLGRLVGLLRSLLRATDNPDLLRWMRELLTNPHGVFVELLKSLGKSAHGIPGRELRYGIIHLAQELIQAGFDAEPTPWITLVHVVNEYLDTNLADHLDCFLSLLADITGTWTWDYTPHQKLYKSVVTHVIEVIMSFKGVAESQDSFMGSNIINSALLILGQMLCDASSMVLGWEQVWEDAMRQAAGVVNLFDADYSWLLTLVSYRDPVTRASALTLLSGLFASAKAYHLLVDGLDMGMGHIWATALSIITDRKECALVREKAAVLLERLTTLGAKLDCSEFLDYINNEGIYEKVGDIFTSKRLSFDITTQNTTNCLISALSNWIFMVLGLNKTLVAQHIAGSSLIHSLIKITAAGDIEGSDDWLKTNASIIRLLRACVKASPKARDIVLSSNLVQFLFSLLSFSSDVQNCAGLQCFRLECFYILAVILETENGIDVFKKLLPDAKILEIISEAIESSVYRERVLVLINNLATPQLNHYFTKNLENGTFGETVCGKLILCDLKESAVCLASVFLVSSEGQGFALRHGGCEIIIKQINKLASKLGQYAVAEYRKPTIKKKLDPVLNDTETIYKLLTNFCYKNILVKDYFSERGLPDIVHRLWPWYTVSSKLLITTLKMICTFTHQSEKAAQAVALTSPANGPRRGTLIHTITQLITKEMDLLTKIRNTDDLSYALQILSNCCQALECRVALAKGTILQPVVKLLPTENKKRIFGDDLLEIWLHFFNAFTAYPEGQLCVSKDTTTFEFIFVMASSLNPQIRKTALSVILHLAMNSQNRCRLLSKPAPLLNLLLTVLKSENEDLIRLATATLWALAANSQKAKILIRNAGCVDALQNALQFCGHSDNIYLVEQALHTITI